MSDLRIKAIKLLHVVNQKMKECKEILLRQFKIQYNSVSLILTIDTNVSKMYKYCC